MRAKEQKNNDKDNHNKNKGTFRGTVGSQTINCIKTQKYRLKNLESALHFKKIKQKSITVIPCE